MLDLPESEVEALELIKKYNVDYILLQQAGSDWIKQNNPFILSVDIKPYLNKLKTYISYADFIPKVCPHEFYVEERIPAMNILKVTEWRKYDNVAC